MLAFHLSQALASGHISVAIVIGLVSLRSSGKSYSHLDRKMPFGVSFPKRDCVLIGMLCDLSSTIWLFSLVLDVAGAHCGAHLPWRMTPY